MTSEYAGFLAMGVNVEVVTGRYSPCQSDSRDEAQREVAVALYRGTGIDRVDNAVREALRRFDTKL